MTLRGQGLRCLEVAHDVPLIQPFEASVGTIKNTIKVMCSIAAQYAVGNEAAQLHPAPSSSGEASPDIIIQDAEEGAKGSKKRRKQPHQETTLMTDDDCGNNKQVGSSSVVHTTATAGSGKHQVRPPIDHFEKLLEETCLNHTYPVKHKLRDCDMMKNFMALGSLA
jgi:hypothetical protein